MDKITLAELADALAKQKKSLSKKEAEAFVREVFETIRENLFVDEVVKVKGLGTFKSVRVESRESVHVNTGKRIVIDSHSKITFTPDKSLSDCVNRPFAAFETMILNDETSTEEMERIDDVPEQPAEVADEPVPEVEVAQPEPEVLEEPQPEPEVVEEPQPEPEVVEEAEPEPAPAVEESTPVVEEEPAPVEVEEPAPVPETPSQGRSAGRSVLWILLLLLIAGGAYWLYSTKGNTGSDAEAVAEAKTEVKADTQTQ
ncbi:MAG: HU family DNA-binding protein, partial [Bacteroidaceae bacterium]|nr:HU family DNA-binding protein [Bacteroidaceae bacterium]